jgi:CBS domain-containing protein
MSSKVKSKTATPLSLQAETAADLMHTKPVSIRDDATIQEAIAMLTDKGFSAAPVIDGAGRPVGVVSRSDILTHDRERVDYLAPVPDYYEEELSVARRTGERPEGFQLVNVDRTLVREIMTPVVFSVNPGTLARKVVQEMLSLKVHRLFVVDHDGVLVGVISATDILEHLEVAQPKQPGGTCKEKRLAQKGPAGSGAPGFVGGSTPGGPVTAGGATGPGALCGKTGGGGIGAGATGGPASGRGPQTPP